MLPHFIDKERLSGLPVRVIGLNGPKGIGKDTMIWRLIEFYQAMPVVRQCVTIEPTNLLRQVTNAVTLYYQQYTELNGALISAAGLRNDYGAQDLKASKLWETDIEGIDNPTVRDLLIAVSESLLKELFGNKIVGFNFMIEAADRAAMLRETMVEFGDELIIFSPSVGFQTELNYVQACCRELDWTFQLIRLSGRDKYFGATDSRGYVTALDELRLEVPEGLDKLDEVIAEKVMPFVTK